MWLHVSLLSYIHCFQFYVGLKLQATKFCHYFSNGAPTPSQRKARLLLRSQESFCMAKYK